MDEARSSLKIIGTIVGVVVGIGILVFIGIKIRDGGGKAVDSGMKKLNDSITEFDKTK